MKKLKTICIGVMLLLTLFPGVIAGFEQNNETILSVDDTNDVGCIGETYLITNPKVPYVGQGNDSFCALASTAMQIKYQEFNITLPEILHDVGYGYLRTYWNVIPSSRLPLGGAGICSMVFNMELLAEIYNLTFKDFSLIQEPNESSLWESYYEKVKELISLDIPVQTGVDSHKLTYWNERFNFSNDTSGGHAIVIVGYNDTNKTICYNDPGAAIINDSVNGTYVWEDQEIFKSAVENMNGFYKIYVFYEKNQTDKPTRRERFEKAHDMNIRRLQGDFKYYFGVDINPSDLPFMLNLFFSTCFHSGINATEKQKIDINGPLQRLITVSLYKRYETIFFPPYYAYYDVFQQIENVSTYLLEQQNLSPLCLHDGLLLKRESMLWKNLSIYIQEIQEINMNNSLFKTLTVTNPIFDEMISTLDEILDIEQEILNYNLNENDGTQH